jgi:hypothetical protein
MFKPYLHLSFSKVAWTLCWSCELVGSRVVYSSVIRSSLRAPVQVWELLNTGVSNSIQYCDTYRLRLINTPISTCILNAPVDRTYYEELRLYQQRSRTYALLIKQH